MNFDLLVLFVEVSTQPFVHRPTLSFLTVDNHHLHHLSNTAKMGRVRTKTVKKSAKVGHPSPQGGDSLPNSSEHVHENSSC